MSNLLQTAPAFQKTSKSQVDKTDKVVKMVVTMLTTLHRIHLVLQWEKVITVRWFVRLFVNTGFVSCLLHHTYWRENVLGRNVYEVSGLIEVMDGMTEIMIKSGLLFSAMGVSMPSDHTESSSDIPASAQGQYS